MNEWNQAREDFEAIPIPEELNARVCAGIAEGRRKARRKRLWARSGLTVAACFAVLFAGLNLSPAFAESAAKAPVVGGLCRVLTVTIYREENKDMKLSVDQPEVDSDAAVAKKVNAEIQKRVKEKTAEGKQLVADYKDAFLSTGGTEKEWEEHDNRVTVDYEIKTQTKDTISFVVNTNCNIANAYQESYFYNLDIARDRELTLKDVLGKNWVEICNASIRKQIADSKDPSAFFDKSMGGFTTVDKKTSFYLNAKGNPVVVFPRYTIACGAMGQVEFEIQK